MARGKGHTTKNRLEKEHYVKYIRTQDYEPTKEEGLNFNDSSDKEEDFSVSKTNKPRRLSFKDQVKEHFSNHWLEWLIGGLTAILIFFTFSAKLELSNHEIKIEQNEKGIESTTKKIEEIQKDNTRQDLEIQEVKIRQEYLEKSKKDTLQNGK